MKNIYVESLDYGHGAKIIEAFNKLGVNTGIWTGVNCRDGGDSERFYGVTNNKFSPLNERDARDNGEIITLEQLENLKTKNTMNNNHNTAQAQLKVSLTKELDFAGEKRTITVVTLVDGGEVKTGYAIRLPEDKADDDLALKIATGRALKEKTNLTSGMVMGIGMDKKYILYAIAENAIRVIGKGNVVKGIKPRKTDEVK